MHVRWDKSAAATPHGQLVFFAEFLAATGVFERWVSSCPLEYRSGNAPDKRGVLGTLMLGLLAGHRRYAHITALRGDAVAAQALGMNKVVSDDALRRALERIDEASSTAWMRPAVMHSVREALSKPWVLDIDTSIKPLYGQVSSGKQHTRAHAQAALGRLLDELGDGPDRRRPALVRGDSGCGSEGILLELASRVDGQAAQAGLGRPKRARGRSAVGVRGAGHRCEVPDPGHRADLPRLGRLRERVRRVEEPVGTVGLHDAGHQPLPDHGPGLCAGLQLVELVLPGGQSDACMEAITSRLLLLAAVGRAAHSSGQTTLYLTPMHGKANLLKPLIANVHAALQHVKAAAEQFKSADRWAMLLRYVSDKIAPTLGPFRPPTGLPATR